MRVLLVKSSALGDIVHALPALAYLHQVAPGIRVDWVVEERFRDLLDGNPLINQLHLIRTKAWKRHPFAAATRREIAALRQALVAASYDMAFDLQSNIKSGVIARLSGAPLRYGYVRAEVREAPNIFFTNAKVSLQPEDYHVTDRVLRIVSVPFGSDFCAATIPTDIHTTIADDAAAAALLSPFGPGSVLLFHHGTTWLTKLWHEQGWVELGKLALENFPKASILLSWGNDQEREVAGRIAAAIGGRACLLPRLSLKGLAALLKKVDLVVGGDTGPVQMAAAVGTPTVSFYRATDALRTGPRGAKHLVIQAPMECCDCMQKQCDRDALCRQSIEAPVLMEGISRLLTGKIP